MKTKPNNLKSKHVRVQKQAIEEFCHRNHITKLAFFGSVLRDDFRKDSDIDVLVEFEPEHVPGFFRLAGMERELSKSIGRRVDLRTPQDLSKYFRDRVLESAQVQYERV